MDKLGPGDPQVIGAYRLLARLGAGGMGQVYLARSERGRTVAVKLVREELARREEFRARFRQEVRAARQVGGDWTAPVLDADTEAPVPWVATGYVAGPSLQQVVGHDHGALPERSVRILGAGLAHALKDIHAAGIVHRDLKPSNVLVTIDGPRVIDFGIARALETVTDGGLTRTGALVGSPGFMAPEQVRGDRITQACDVFCLGSVLAYAASGALPFGTAGSGVHALMFRIAQEEPDLAGVPEGLADLVRDCLHKDPAARPPLDEVLRRTGADDTVADGRARDPWLPGALVAQLGRHAVRLLDTENPEPPPPSPTTTPTWPPAGHQSPPGPADPEPAASGGPVAGQPASAPAQAPPAGHQAPAGPSGPGAAGQPGGSADQSAATPAWPPAGRQSPPGPADPEAAASGGPVAGQPGSAPAQAPPAGRQAPAGPSGPGAAGQPGSSADQSAATPAWPSAGSAVPGAPAWGPAGGHQSPPGPAASGGPVAGQPASAPAQAPPAGHQAPAGPSGPGVPGGPVVGQPLASGSGVAGQPGGVAAPGPGAGHQAPAGSGGSGVADVAAGSGGSVAFGGGSPGAGGQPGGGSGTAGAGGFADSAGTPEHARAADDSVVPPRVHHPPTLVAGQGAPAPHPGPYGHPQQPAYGYPYDGYGAGQAPPAPEQRRDGRSTALLVVIALVVALGAGGSVYALMSGGDADHRTGGDPTAPPSPTAATSGDTPGSSTSAPADGTIPAGYLGSWSTTIDNASGQHTRRLTLQQGDVGDTVMSLVAEGPTGDGTYHCVFEARLTGASGDRLELGPSAVSVGQPSGACTPGSASELTLLSGGSLQRVNTGDGEHLTYTRD
ncbi:protein kinase [Streptomyces fungicidicus]|uniref:serine/threonine-protein kinase n=1 Tax=Streptomyces fungicidicus TaxID=68203 RepID=UPI00363B032E